MEGNFVPSCVGISSLSRKVGAFVREGRFGASLEHEECGLRSISNELSQSPRGTPFC